MEPVELLTVGHGRSDRVGLTSLLQGARVLTVVDVRRFPGSRRNPDVSRDALPGWLPDVGIDYRWEERLGGRRTIDADGPVLDPWWRVESFRAYAAHTRTDVFAAAMADLLVTARDGVTAVMCSESVWWRCHRRLIADVALLVHGVSVLHLMPDGRLHAHRPSDGARSAGAGQLVWDGLPAPPADTRASERTFED